MSHKKLALRDIRILGHKRTRADRDYDISYYQQDRDRLLKMPLREWPTNMLVSVPKVDVKIIPGYLRLMENHKVKIIEDQSKYLELLAKTGGM